MGIKTGKTKKIQMENKKMQRLKIISYREVHIKTTMRCHHTAIRIAKMVMPNDC